MRHATIAILAGLAGLAGCQSLDVISFTATTTTVTGGAPLASETDTVTFVAVETEINGSGDDLAGGVLTDKSGATYGAIQATASGGPYTVTLSFAQINEVSPIEFAAPGGHREFIASFFDDDSDEVTRAISLELTCRTAAGLTGACNGTCIDWLADVVNCGACGNTCGAGESCVAGACTAGG